MRGWKSVCKASLVANVAAQKSNCTFCHENVSYRVHGNSAQFCEGNTEVILCACSLRKGIAPECGRVQSKNSELLCLQENRTVCMPQSLVMYRHGTEMIWKMLRMKISFAEDHSHWKLRPQLSSNQVVNYHPWARTGMPAGPMLYSGSSSARLLRTCTGLNKCCNFTEFWRMLVSRMKQSH